MMVRSFVVLLLLVVVFLTGMLLGMDREQDVLPQNFQKEMETSDAIADRIDNEMVDLEKVTEVEHLNDIEAPIQSTQKLASFLEIGVKGFYDAIVEVLYQISSLFI